MNGPDDAVAIAVGGVESCVNSESGPKNVCAQHGFAADTINPADDTSAVIEISDDGTWETKPASTEEHNILEPGSDGIVTEESEIKPSFLAPRDDCILENVKIKHVTLAHSSQYYVNCPVASVKPMVHEAVSNGTGGIETADMKSVKVNETFSNDGETEPKPTKIECPSLVHVGITNGGSVIHTEVKEGALVNIEADSYTSCQSVVPDEQVLAGDRITGSEDTDSGPKPATALEEDFTVNTSIDSAGGDVVTDSILQNKEKTKTYWEEMMMAAASGKESPHKARPSESRGGEDCEEAPAVFFDPEANGEEGTAWSLGGTCPKIVETVAKRIESREDASDVGMRESVVEREIRLQKEREEALVREREDAHRTSPSEQRRPSPEKNVVEEWSASLPPTSSPRLETPAEVKIALELREMREREEELRKLRQQLGLAKESGQEASEGGETFHSIPTTDEGNFSECGGEEKDLGIEVISSQMMSPDMPSLDMPSENSCSFMHRRTQSTDSTSSGHSSGSGGPRSGPEYPPRRRVIVKPLADAEEDGSQPQLFRRSMTKEEDDMFLESQQPSILVRTVKETPIEREIRIAHEREEELRREKGLVQRSNQTLSAKPEVSVRSAVVPITHHGKGPQNVQLRLATNRIQREIQETTEREKELRDAGKIQTMSEDTVDSKVTRIGEISESDGAVLEYNKKMQKSVSASHINVPDPSPPEPDEDVLSANPSVLTTPTKSAPPNVSSFTLGRSISANTGLGLIGSNNSTPSPRRFTPIAGQKGLMERFLASRGKLTCISPFSSSSSSSSPASTSTNPMNFSSPVKTVTTTLAVVHKPIDILPVDNRQVSNDTEPTESTAVPHRRGWMSAEEKIQEELKEMKMREDELRLQRAHIMAQSQPNLLSIMDEIEESSQLNEDDSKLPSLYSTLSNPNLLDLDGDAPVKELDLSQEQVAQKNSRRKSTLIAQWESRIQQNTDH